MARQLAPNDALARRLRDPWRWVVVLERIAGGRWYLARSHSDWAEMARRCRGGSCVTFFFDSALRLAEDTTSTRREIDLFRRGKNEVVVGRVDRGEVLADDVLLDPSEELAEFFGEPEKDAVLFPGDYPGRKDDGDDVLKFVFVDEDAMLRPHPH